MCQADKKGTVMVNFMFQSGSAMGPSCLIKHRLDVAVKYFVDVITFKSVDFE